MAQRKTKTISVPPDLDEQLDHFPNENWSAVACEAFRLRLKQLQAMNTMGTTAAAVARLRASRERGISEKFAAGELAGADFAMNQGEFNQLERLERFRDKCGINWHQVAGQLGLRQLAKVMASDEDDEAELEDWFKGNYGQSCNESGWLDGFVQGAAAKFAELRENL